MSNTVRWAAPELAPPPPPPPQEPVRHMPSVEELQAIEEAAHAEGYARGHAEGVAAGQAEVRRIAAQMEGILDAFTRPLARLDAEVGDALGDLAMLSPQLVSLQGVRLAGDSTLARGDLRLHADSVRIDGSLSARLNAALQRIMAGAGA